MDDVVAQVGRGGHPLALYVFTDDPSFVAETRPPDPSSGGVAVNSVAGHAVLPSLGFGGVGASGMGRHHGRDGFRGLSNPRGYFALGSGSVTQAVTPPYGPQTRALLDIADGTTPGHTRASACPACCATGCPNDCHCPGTEPNPRWQGGWR